MPQFNIDNIDPRFVDVDFRAYNPNSGCLGVNPDYDQRFRAYEDSQPLVPTGDWQKHHEAMEAEGGGAERLVTRVFNQKSEGSCVGNAWTQATQVVCATQFGKENVVQLSAISAYKQIGRSPGSGAMVDDALEAGKAVGVLPLDTPENRTKFGNHVMPHTGFHTPFPDGWKETAKKFRIAEAFVIRSYEGLMSALFNHHPVVVGRQGHSICYLRPVLKSGSWHVLYVNSWGNWGVGAGDFEAGFGVDSPGQVRSSSGWAFAVTSVVVPS
jgi:hypothetical protein